MEEEQQVIAPALGRRQAWLAFLKSLRGQSVGKRGGRPEAIRQAWQQLRHREAIAELWQGDQRLLRVDLDGGRKRIGRDPGCELPLEVAGVSRVHAILERTRASDRDYTLEDFNSANGLFHRDRRIKAISLRDGDAVWLGSPLKGDAPVLRYHHPRSALEQVIHWLGIGSLAGSALLVSGMLAAATIAGGSRIRAISGPVKIFSASGQQIDVKEGSSTALPSLQSYPLHLRQALMASEEARFGWNSGLDLFGTLRSALRRSGGGSGLTQQVARMVYPDVGRDLSLTRKLRELWVALQLEVGFSKNQILKLYLDRAYLGLGAEGFEQAAQLYFRRSASDLDEAQSAFLVGLLPSPNGYSPCNTHDPGAGLERRNLVLKLMHEQGWLSDQALIDAERRPLNIDPSACRESSFTSYPFFADYVIGELEGTRFGLDLSSQDAAGNYAVFSTIDPKVQALAQTQLQRFLEGPAASVGLTQGALITLNTSTGDILAYVGGGDYARSSFDRVQALRQPGSSFKLFPYLAALKAGVTPSDPISCAPLGYVAGCSHGAGGPGGSATVSDGLAFSENVVALRLAKRVGLGNVIKLARRLGISTPSTPTSTRCWAAARPISMRWRAPTPLWLTQAARCPCTASAASTTWGSASRSRAWIAARSVGSLCRSASSHASCSALRWPLRWISCSLAWCNAAPAVPQRWCPMPVARPAPPTTAWMCSSSATRHPSTCSPRSGWATMTTAPPRPPAAPWWRSCGGAT